MAISHTVWFRHSHFWAHERKHNDQVTDANCTWNVPTCQRSRSLYQIEATLMVGTGFRSSSSRSTSVDKMALENWYDQFKWLFIELAKHYGQFWRKPKSSQNCLRRNQSISIHQWFHVYIVNIWRILITGKYFHPASIFIIASSSRSSRPDGIRSPRVMQDTGPLRTLQLLG